MDFPSYQAQTPLGALHMSWTKTSATVAALAAIAILATGCGATTASSASSASFTKKPGAALTTYGVNPTDEVANARVAYAEAQLKKQGVTVSMNKTAFAPQKFTAQLASGNVPDLVEMDRQDVATYAAKGLILPLDKCYSATNVTVTKHYYPATLSQLKYKGALYGVPEFWQTNAIMVNQRVMHSAGVTASELSLKDPSAFLAAATKMYRSSGGKPTVIGLDPGVAGGNASTWMLAFGGSLQDANGKPTLNSAANVKALSWLKRVYDAQGGYAKATSFINTFDYFGADNQYVKDQVGSELVQQWYPNVLTASASKIDVTAVPLTNLSGQAIGVAGGNAFVIPKASNNPTAACRFAVDMTSDAAWMLAAKARAATVAKTPGSIFTGLFTGSSTADSAIDKLYIKPSGKTGFDEAIKAFTAELSHGVSAGSSPVGLQITAELQNAVVPAMTGTKSVQAALDAAQNAAMSDYTSAQH
jgi:multiple sugar transport system substrate-binding protein